VQQNLAPVGPKNGRGFLLRWAALAVLSLFCDIGIGRRPAATVDFVWLLPGGPHNKNQEIIAASNRALEGSSSSSEAPLALLRLWFDLLKAGSLAIHRFHVFGQCPPLLRQIEVQQTHALVLTVARSVLTFHRLQQTRLRPFVHIAEPEAGMFRVR